MDVWVCSDCGEPFKVEEHDLPMPGTKEKEPINCPHCGHENGQMTSNGWWVTYRLTADELEKWKGTGG